MLFIYPNLGPSLATRDATVSNDLRRGVYMDLRNTPSIRSHVKKRNFPLRIRRGCQ